MPVIRLSDTTWERLKPWAVPLEDSADDAVRKVLDAAEEHLKCTQTNKVEPSYTQTTRPVQNGRLPSGQATPQSAYNQLVMEAIYELGGRARARDVLEVVEKNMNMQGLLTDEDYQCIPSGQIRWKKNANWARFKLKDEYGLLKSDSPTGIWELSSMGLREIESRVKDSSPIEQLGENNETKRVPDVIVTEHTQCIYMTDEEALIAACRWLDIDLSTVTDVNRSTITEENQLISILQRLTDWEGNEAREAKKVIETRVRMLKAERIWNEE